MEPFHYSQRELHCEETPLSLISAQFGTPTYVYSQAELTRRAAAYLSAVPAGATVCYAVKANGNPAILRLLGGIGLGADVTSGGELFLALHAGIPPSKIIYSGVGKTQAEIEYALSSGIFAINVESEMELDSVAETASTLEIIAPIGVRVNPNISADTHPYISTGMQEHKFGVQPDHAMAMMAAAALHPWMRPVSLAAHIGSQITDITPFASASTFLVGMAEELAASGIYLSHIDLGGGLGISYQGDAVPSIADWVSAAAGPPSAAGFTAVIEPGRSIVGPAGALLTKVIYRKSQGNKQFLVTDAAMNDLIRPTLYHAHHPILTVQQPAADGKRELVDVVGPVCESGDFLAKERSLPVTSAGELLVILSAGAYGFAMSSNYNGRLRPAEVLVDGADARLIRQRQSYSSLLDGCQE